MNAYWKFRLRLMNAWGVWDQFKFNFHERVKSTSYSIKVGSWHKPCIECWGSKESMKYAQLQPCRMGCEVGYQRTDFWLDMKYMFYPDQKIYYFKYWLKRTFLGCSKRNWKVWHEHCRYGTCGCDNHPLVQDWQGLPLDKLDKK